MTTLKVNKNKTTCDMTVDHRTKGITFAQLCFYDDKNVLDDFLKDAVFSPTSSHTFRNVGYSGGSSYVIDDAASGKWYVSVWRDRGAWVMARKLDNLSGGANSTDLVQSAVREAMEEVLVLVNNTVQMPDLTHTSISAYTQEVAELIRALAQKFGIPPSQVRDVPITRIPFDNPYFLDGRQVVYELVTDRETDLVKYINIMLPPTVIAVDTTSAEQGPLSFRESLAKETNGAAPERKVVAINMKTLETIVYHHGPQVARYGAVQDLIRGDSELNADYPLTPSNLRTMIAMGQRGGELARFAKELAEVPGALEGFRRL